MEASFSLLCGHVCFIVALPGNPNMYIYIYTYIYIYIYIYGSKVRALEMKTHMNMFFREILLLIELLFMPALTDIFTSTSFA
jgi:hypothetical protein